VSRRKARSQFPQKIREKWQLQKGDLVAFIETEEGVLIKPAEVVTGEVMREELFARALALQNRFDDLNAGEVDALVNEAIAWARQ
jgi:bifunctional DNA-binding transcriptional regulator/antitoxin component of YhaV-PrlF toxin-antitoxin module